VQTIFPSTCLVCLSLLLLAPLARAADAGKDDPETELRSFRVPDGYEVNLFASEKDGIIKPVQMRWDPKGRLWVSCIPSYPHPKPGEQPDDRIVVLEDTMHTGHADRSTVFVRGLMLPLGLELGDGGVYVTDNNDLAFFSDTTGGLHADHRTPVLRGFFSGDSHQDINSFIWGPGGELMFCQGLHAFSRVETPWGLERLEKAGVFRYWPRIGRLDPFLGWDRGPQNPWGVVFDDWGQPILTAGNGQGIYYLLSAMIRTQHFLDPRKIDETRNIKYCGVDIIGTRAMPDDVQGLLVAGSILNNAVYWFKLNDDGSGFHAKDLPPLLVSTSANFRAVDVKVGPDGAIYVADFYNPIIGHYQASLRHPDRDHTHGRIWRITAKGRKLAEQPELVKLPANELFEQLRSPERWTRYQVKRILAGKNAREDCDGLGKWISRLDANDPQLEHLLYEALGVYESHEVVVPGLLNRLLSAKDYRARAYAASVIGHWQDRLPDPLALLRTAAADESPRVRVAAVVSASYVPSPRAIEAAAIVADKPMDRFINEAFIQATAALKPYWQPVFEAGQLTFDNKPERLAALCRADGTPSVLESLYALVRGGKLAGDSHDGAVVLLAEMGGSDLLKAMLEDPALRATPPLLARALEAMAANFRLRKTMPAGNVAATLRPFLNAADENVRRRAVTLAGLCRLEGARVEIESAARDAASSDELRRAGAEALADLGGEQSTALLAQLGGGFPGASRSIAIAALARLDLKRAAGLAAQVLADPGGGAQVPVLVPAFLSRQGGADALGAALAGAAIPKDTAKLMLRTLSAAGGQTDKLWEIASKAAGHAGAKLEYDAQLVQSLAAEALKSGDPAAGQRVFRSQLTNCLACHAIGGAGGRVGPDLAPVGTALPIDLVVESVLWPQRQIKEGYSATMVQTKDGEVVQGYRASEDKTEFVLRDPATGRVIHIPASNIKAKRDIGSLMPEGLTESLTRKELVDLIRFLSELGKPGPWRVAATPLVRVWEAAPPQARPGEAEPWVTHYSMTDGSLPLDEIATGGSTGRLRCTVDVVKPGRFTLKINDEEGLALTVDAAPGGVHGGKELPLPAGRHAFAISIDFKVRKTQVLSLQIEPAGGSGGEVRLPGNRAD
jgi:putative heme-binding domain-containing protein